MTGATRRPPIGAFGRRVGLYGGSFDPVHAGHLHVARLAQRSFALDQIVFVPAAAPPHKLERRLASGDDRVRMLELALADGPSWSIWRVELEREGPSYTVDTLRSARAELGLKADAELHLLIGWDNLRGFERWRAVTEVLELAQPIVVWRGAEDAATLARLRAALGESAYARIERGLLRAPPAPESSTAVRDALACGADVGDALPRGVLEYIRARGIYGGKSDS